MRHKVDDPSGPYYHQARLATIQGTGPAAVGDTLLAEHASVPDGARAADGTIRMLYVSGEDGAVHGGTVQGSSFVDEGFVRVDGIDGPNFLVDPDLTRLRDGRWLLAYFQGSLTPPRPGSGQLHDMCLAVGTSAKKFRSLGLLVQVPDGTDPSLARDGTTWYLAVSAGTRSLVYAAKAGRAFTEVGAVDGGVPELSVPAKGTLRIMVCGGGGPGIRALDSTNGGRTWTDVGTVVDAPPGTIVCDPSVVAGTDVVLYKTAAAMKTAPPPGPG
jgi:hypothetical protein